MIAEAQDWALRVVVLGVVAVALVPPAALFVASAASRVHDRLRR